MQQQISGDASSFVKSHQGDELFYAPVGLCQVLLRAQWLPVGQSMCLCPILRMSFLSGRILGLGEHSR